MLERVDLDRLYEFVADPKNRPLWQFSLRDVQLQTATIDEVTPRVGLGWREQTLVPGVWPSLEITALDPGAFWAERGRWQGVEATLELSFSRVGDLTRVHADGVLTASGPWTIPAWLAARTASPAIRHDLRTAARIVAER